MTTRTSITKLTPPQIVSLRDAFPGLVGAGILTTTRSIATFDLGEHVPTHPNLKGWEPTPDSLIDLLSGAVEAGKLARDRALPILRKLTADKDVRVETAAA